MHFLRFGDHNNGCILWKFHGLVRDAQRPVGRQVLQLIWLFPIISFQVSPSNASLLIATLTLPFSRNRSSALCYRPWLDRGFKASSNSTSVLWRLFLVYTKRQCFLYYLFAETFKDLGTKRRMKGHHETAYKIEQLTELLTS